MTIVPALLGANVPLPGTTWAMATGPDAIGVALGMRHSAVAFDIETFGLGPLAWKLKAVCFSDGHTSAVLDPREPQQAAAILRVITDAPKLIAHNSVFDVPVLYQNKMFPLSCIDKVWDTLLWARLSNPDTFTPKSLEAVGDRLGVHAKGTPIKTVFKQLGLSTAAGFAKFDLDVVQYLYGAALDGLVTFHIADKVRDEAKKTLLSNPYSSFKVMGAELEHLLDREQIVNRVLLRRACLGMRVDFEFAEQYRQTNAQAMSVIEKELDTYGVKPGNGNSLLAFLDGIGAIERDHPKTPTGKLQATAAVLEAMTHPLAHQFVQHKRLQKVQRDYLDGLVELSTPTGGRIHPRTNILAAVTGRMSVSSPALQQLPNEARGILMADEGQEWTSIDWKQIEPVLAANIAGDMGVLKNYENVNSEGDLYTDLADYVSARGTPLSRKAAKTTVLGLLYGLGMAKLTAQLGVDPGRLVETDRGWVHEFLEARAIKEQTFSAMPKTEEMSNNIKRAAKQHRCVPTVSGRLIPIPVFRNKETGEEEVGSAKGLNYVIQGSAADLMMETVARCHAAGLADEVMFTVHDEMVCTTASAQDVERIMQTPPDSLVRAAERTPVLRTDRFDMGDRWRVE